MFTILKPTFGCPSLVPSPLPAAILQWPEKVVWRLWSTFLGLEASLDYVTLVGAPRCGICTGKMAVQRCVVCSCSVANPSFRRRIESSPQVLAFAKSVGLRLAETESSNQYVCRTCFSKLEKGSKVEGTLRSTVQDILRCAGQPHDVSVSIRSISCDQGTQTQTDREEEQRDSNQGEQLASYAAD